MGTNYASKVIKIAEQEIGYLEKNSNANIYDKTAGAGNQNYNKYAYEFDTIYKDFYNGVKNHYAAWCDIFVDWCIVKAFGEETALKLLNQPKKSYGAGCTWSVKYYKGINAFYYGNPRIGDQIFFNDSSGEPCHTGLVYDVDGKYVYTIEGNTSSASGVVANGGAVAKKRYELGYARIYGYGRPAYDPEPKTVAKKTVTAKVVGNPQYNSKVKAFQNAAIADGYKKYLASGADGIWGNECETLAKKLVLKKQTLVYTNKNLVKFVQTLLKVKEIDGKFGNDTKKAVIAFQKKNKLEADGIVGYNTIKKLCGVL